MAIRSSDSFRPMNQLNIERLLSVSKKIDRARIKKKEEETHSSARAAPKWRKQKKKKEKLGKKKNSVIAFGRRRRCRRLRSPSIAWLILKETRSNKSPSPKDVGNRKRSTSRNRFPSGGLSADYGDGAAADADRLRRRFEIARSSFCLWRFFCLFFFFTGFAIGCYRVFGGCDRVFPSLTGIYWVFT